MTVERPMRSWGHPGVRDLDRIVVVSPHLDDAVLGCGLLLDAVPGTTVLTVFTGAPESYPDPMRPWEAESLLLGEAALLVDGVRADAHDRGAESLQSRKGVPQIA